MIPGRAGRGLRTRPAPVRPRGWEGPEIKNIHDRRVLTRLANLDRVDIVWFSGAAWTVVTGHPGLVGSARRLTVSRDMPGFQDGVSHRKSGVFSERTENLVPTDTNPPPARPTALGRGGIHGLNTGAES